MTITTGSIKVGDHGFTATLTGTANEYSGTVSYYRVDDADGHPVGKIRLVDATSDRVYAFAADPTGKAVTSDWLDLFNDDSGDRDEMTGLDRAANALADAR